MEKPCSYYDWEKNFEKFPEKKKNEPKEIRIINSIGLPHDFFKSYLKLWKSENMAKDKSR
jgi:hypothetical protein